MLVVVHVGAVRSQSEDDSEWVRELDVPIPGHVREINAEPSDSNRLWSRWTYAPGRQTTPGSVTFEPGKEYILYSRAFIDKVAEPIANLFSAEPRLAGLSVQLAGGPVGQTAWESLCVPQLRWLELQLSALSPGCIRGLAESGLRHLHVYGGAWTTGFDLAGVEAISSLESLWLGAADDGLVNSLSLDAGIDAVVISSGSLKTFTGEWVVDPDWDDEEFEPWTSPVMEERLLTADGLKHVCSLPQLRELYLRPDDRAVDPFGGIDAPGWQVISEASGLESFEVSGFSDAGIAELEKLENLRALSIMDAQSVTPTGLAKLGDLTGLETLQLRHVHALTAEAVDWLIEMDNLKSLLIWVDEDSSFGEREAGRVFSALQDCDFQFIQR